MAVRGKKIIKRIAVGLLALTTIVIIAASAALYFWGTEYMRKEISNFVNKETNGNYEVHFTELKIDPLKRSISLSNVEIIPATPETEYEFRLAANRILAEHIKIKKFIQKRELEIGRISINKPVVHFKKSLENNNNLDELANQLRPFINKTFKSIAINKIELTDAGLLQKGEKRYGNKSTQPIGFDVGIENFYTDSVILANSDDFFESKDIFMKITNYSELLGDSLHKLAVNEFIYSIKNKKISAHNISLSPTDTLQLSKTKYWINVPELYIRSSNIDEIFQNDSIKIDSLLVSNAKIKVAPPENRSGMNFKQFREYDLYQLIENDFKQIKIEYLNLRADQLDIVRNGQLRTNKQNFKKINIESQKFQLDSASYLDQKKILYSDNLKMTAEEYIINFSDQVHQFKMNNIQVSTRTNSLYADQLKMVPLDKPNQNTTYVTLYCDSIRLNSVNLSRLYHQREMPLQHIAIYKPDLILTAGKERQARKQSSNSLLYHFIGNYIKGVYSNLVTIEDGKLQFNESDNDSDTGNIRTEYEFKLTDFSLDSISANKTDKLFFATNFDLRFSNYKMKLEDQLHGLTIKNIEVSSLNKRANIQNLHLHVNEQGKPLDLLEKYNKNELYEIKIPYLNLYNTNLHQAFFNKRLNINHFSITEPDIYFEIRAQKKKQKKDFDFNDFYLLFKNYIHDIRIGSLQLKNGKIKLVNHNKRGETISFHNKFNLELDGFRLNEQEIKKNKLLLSDDFELTLEDHLFRLSDQVHFLQAKEIGFSTRKSEVFVKNAILYPDITAEKYNKLGRHLHVNIPDFKLKGIDIKKAYSSKKLNVNQLIINSPDIKIYQSGNSQKKLVLKNITVPLPKEVNELNLDKVKMDNARISVLSTAKHIDKKIADLSLSLNARQVHLAQPLSSDSEQLTAANIETSLSDFNFKPLKGNYNFKARKVDYEKRKRQVEIIDLEILPKDLSEKDGLVSVKFPRLEIIGLNKLENKKRNCIHSNTVFAKGVHFHYIKPGQKKEIPDFYNLKLNEDFLSVVNEISADKIELKDASVSVEYGKDKRLIKDIQLTLDEFRVNENPSTKLFGSEDISLKINKFHATDKNKRYDFNFGELSFSSKPSTFSIRNLVISPKYSKEAYQNIIPFQTDYYDGKIESIDIHNIKMKRFLEDNELSGNQINIRNASLDIFRDMRKQFNENQRPVMPQDLIRQFEIPFHFDSVAIENSTISYAEQLADMPNPGQINFSNLNATIFPLSNIPLMLNFTPNTILNARAMVMGQAELNVKINFNMLSLSNEFYAEGSISPFQLSLLNPMTENAAQLGIRSGQLNRFEFNFAGNNSVAKGKIKFAYDDLKVNILSFKDGNSKESKLASFIANSLVVKSKNPRTRILLPDPIYFERDEKRSILNYWWKSIFSGIKNTFGMKDKNEKK